VCGVGQVRLCMCVSYEECRVAVGPLESVRGVGQVRLCVCVCVYVIRGMPSSYPSAVESECVCVGQGRLSVCVSYQECCVVVSLLERVSVWCWAGPSVYVCVIRGIRVAVGLPDSECVVLGRSVYVCVSYEEYR